MDFHLSISGRTCNVPILISVIKGKAELAYHLSMLSISSPWPTQRQWYQVLQASHLTQRSFSNELRELAWPSTHAGQVSSLSWDDECCSGVLERLMDDGGAEAGVGSFDSSFFVPFLFARAIPLLTSATFPIHSTQLGHMSTVGTQHCPLFSNIE